MNPHPKKKIIIIGPAYPYRGGNALFVSDLYEVLQGAFEVKIYNYSLLYPTLLFPGVTQFDKSEKMIKRVPSQRLINSINPFNWIRVARRLRQERADLVIFDWWQPFFGLCHWALSQWIKKSYSNRILFITENVVSHEGRFIDKILTRIGLANASCFMALSDQVVSELRHYGDRRIYRSELPIYRSDKSEERVLSPNRKELGYAQDDLILLFFGYVRKYKGLELLLTALPAIAQQLPRVQLLVVGEFYDKPEPYLRLIEDLAMTERVKIINRYVANEEVAGFYQLCDLVVLPYRSATQSGILNMAYGFAKPVVVTNVGGLGEFVIDRETGMVVDPPTPEAIARGVIEFFGLRPHVDFQTNIRKRAGQNEFNQMPGLMNEIIESSAS